MQLLLCVLIKSACSKPSPQSLADFQYSGGVSTIASVKIRIFLRRTWLLAVNIFLTGVRRSYTKCAKPSMGHSSGVVRACADYRSLAESYVFIRKTYFLAVKVISSEIRMSCIKSASPKLSPQSLADFLIFRRTFSIASAEVNIPLRRLYFLALTSDHSEVRMSYIDSADVVSSPHIQSRVRKTFRRFDTPTEFHVLQRRSD